MPSRIKGRRRGKTTKEVRNGTDACEAPAAFVPFFQHRSGTLRRLCGMSRGRKGKPRMMMLCSFLPPTLPPSLPSFLPSFLPVFSCKRFTALQKSYTHTHTQARALTQTHKAETDFSEKYYTPIQRSREEKRFFFFGKRRRLDIFTHCGVKTINSRRTRRGTRTYSRKKRSKDMGMRKLNP